eukprot:scaffold1002_cov117-Isochrysis_galbana.AAC.12
MGHLAGRRVLRRRLWGAPPGIAVARPHAAIRLGVPLAPDEPLGVAFARAGGVGADFVGVGGEAGLL